MERFPPLKIDRKNMMMDLKQLFIKELILYSRQNTINIYIHISTKENNPLYIKSHKIPR